MKSWMLTVGKVGGFLVLEKTWNFVFLVKSEEKSRESWRNLSCNPVILIFWLVVHAWARGLEQCGILRMHRNGIKALQLVRLDDWPHIKLARMTINLPNLDFPHSKIDDIVKMFWHFWYFSTRPWASKLEINLSGSKSYLSQRSRHVAIYVLWKGDGLC